ncbi:MAG TPA: PilZ domain-containing protein, partial [Myxococcaceae bacterium]
MGTEEKRAAPRAPFVLRVNFRDRSDCLDATENLSRAGLFVQTLETFPVGQIVHLSVGFPGLLEPVALKGEVVWVRPARGDSA